VRKIAKLIATVCYVGYIPLAPGTVASALGVGLYFLVRADNLAHLLLTFLFLILGFWSSQAALKEFPGKNDPREIVIDEFSSMLIVYLFIPFSLKFVILGFLIFRALDIFKIPPIKKLESFPGGYGIMLDDIAAAIFANLILQLLKFTPCM